MYDLIIIGGGPAAAAAGVYAARKRIKSLLITEDWGGQSKVSADVQNWIGIVSMPGMELAKRVEEHVKAYAEDVLEFVEGARVTRITEKVPASDSQGPVFSVEASNGNMYEAHALIIASGSHRRKLQVPGAAEYESKGVVYCATCDAPLFRGKEVAVVGGGNAGLETAGQLRSYATKITILEQGEEFRGDPVTREVVFKDEKVVPLAGVEVTEIRGETFVKSLVYRNKKTGEIKEIPVQGIFVEIGSLPNTDFVKGLVDMNSFGEIIIDHKTARSSREGIWAAGDATDQIYKQNNISMGDAVKALEDAYVWLEKKKVNA